MDKKRPPLPLWVKALFGLGFLAAIAMIALHLSGHGFGHGF